MTGTRLGSRLRLFGLRCILLLSLGIAGCSCPRLPRDGVTPELLRSRDHICRSVSNGKIHVDREFPDEESRRLLIAFEEDPVCVPGVPILRWAGGPPDRAWAGRSFERSTETDGGLPSESTLAVSSRRWTDADFYQGPPANLRELVTALQSRERWRGSSLRYRASITEEVSVRIDGVVFENCQILSVESEHRIRANFKSLRRLLVVDEGGEALGQFYLMAVAVD